MKKEKFGNIAVRRGYITRKQLEEALRRQIMSRKMIMRELVEAGFLTSSEGYEILNEQYDLPESGFPEVEFADLYGVGFRDGDGGILH